MNVSMDRFVRGVGVALMAAFITASCSDENAPSSTSVTLSAPTVASPTSGSQAATNQPTLTVNNVTIAGGATGAVPTYAFQVATDAAFTGVTAQASGIAQGAAGQTAWSVNVALDNRQYFWRARASAGTTDGPYSTPADFTVGLGAFRNDNGPILVQDPLTGGSSVGTVRGGSFNSAGWRVNNLTDFIRYDLQLSPPLSAGFVEWRNSGLSPRNPTVDAYMLFGMWDPTRGEYRTNPFRVHLQKRDDRHLAPFMRLRWISEGQEIEPAYHKTDWDPSRTYQWRLEWGPEAGTNYVRMFLDGEEVMTGRHNRPYAPATHYIEMGINEQRGESVLGAVYSNVRIGRR